jgi:hypothetical protein
MAGDPWAISGCLRKDAQFDVAMGASSRSLMLIRSSATSAWHTADRAGIRTVQLAE